MLREKLLGVPRKIFEKAKKNPVFELSENFTVDRMGLSSQPKKKKKKTGRNRSFRSKILG